jgi:cobalt-zinc-cadmium efflux system protein
MGTEGESSDRGRLRFALILTAMVFVAELATGLLTGSLALIADSAHMFLDSFAVGLSLVALYLAGLPATEQRTYGWHRTEVLAALVNGMLLTFISVEISIHGVNRLMNPREVVILPMIAVAFVGLLTNVVVALKLRRPEERDINLRGAYLHVLGDLMASVAVVAGGFAMMATGVAWIDPLLAMAIACLVLLSALRLLREALHMLLEGVPAHIRTVEVCDAIAGVPGVASVHDVHVWAICSHILSLSCHVRVDDGRTPGNNSIIDRIGDLVDERFGISHTTIQVEHGKGKEPMISQDLNHAGPVHLHEHGGH